MDLARFVAAFGIVWDHARAPFADEGCTALALFLLLTSFLAVGSDQPFAALADPWTLLIGPSIHLWFLPFVILFFITIPWISCCVDRPTRLYLASTLPLFWFGVLLAVARRVGQVWPVLLAAALTSALLYLRAPEFASVEMILVALLFEAIWRLDISGK